MRRVHGEVWAIRAAKRNQTRIFVRGIPAMIDIYAGEAQLARWSETSANGAMITLWLPDGDALENFKLLTERKGKQAGQILAIVVKSIDDDAQPATPAPQIEKPGKGPYGHWYSCLYPGWFASEPVRKAFEPLIVHSPCKRLGYADEVKAVLYEMFDVDSLSWIKPADFAKEMDRMGLYWTLPTLLRVKEAA